ncbi:MAG: hypothetical protein IANPNBLG_03651 [Bryobacteraceae bacterium]|nr:hypothetical protein [Bryobacteraceae bacterium]
MLLGRKIASRAAAGTAREAVSHYQDSFSVRSMSGMPPQLAVR